MSEVLTQRVDEIVFREDLYPRLETSPATVQKYAEDLGVLPPIEVNQHHELIDGWHRWTAHKEKDVAEILVTVTKTASDADLLELAISRNATHGLQLSLADKQDMARRIYATVPATKRDTKKAELAKLLSVELRTIQKWLSRIDKDNKEKEKQQIFDAWLACYTQQEIASNLGLTRDMVQSTLESFVGKRIFSFSHKTDQAEECPVTADEEQPSLSLTVPQQADASHATDFDPPIYNIWKQQEKTDGVKHFGNSEVRWVDNLLYMYTKPFDIVVDPFAGSGSTITLCKKRFRRYWVSDRIVTPKNEKRLGFRQWDLTEALPALQGRWHDVKLVYLDPPYWKQAEGKYSQDPTDLANMDLEKFTETLAGIIRGFTKKLSEGAFVALLIQPTQWKAPERQFTHHVADMLCLIKLPVEMQISCPYESQQCTAQMVEWAKENKKVLVLTRELIVWRI